MKIRQPALQTIFDALTIYKTNNPLEFSNYFKKVKLTSDIHQEVLIQFNSSILTGLDSDYNVVFTFYISENRLVFSSTCFKITDLHNRFNLKSNKLEFFVRHVFDSEKHTDMRQLESFKFYYKVKEAFKDCIDILVKTKVLEMINGNIFLVSRVKQENI